MKKNFSLLYSAIALSAVIAYCGYLLKGGVAETNRTEETLPYAEESTAAIEHSAPAPVGEELPTASLKEAPSEEPSESPAEKVFSPIYPVSGEVVTLFSDSLIYHSATGDWRSHPGLDIKAAKTARVLACEDGTVTRAFTDPLWGNVIEIDHGEYLSVYKNLSTLIMANVGDIVKKGAPISGVGESGAAEGALGPHLHFEIHRNGKAEDPLPLLDKNGMPG